MPEISEASRAWRATAPMILDEMPKFGTVDNGIRTQTLTEDIEETENYILWLEQEIEEQRRWVREIRRVRDEHPHPADQRPPRVLLEKVRSE